MHLFQLYFGVLQINLSYSLPLILNAIFRILYILLDVLLKLYSAAMLKFKHVTYSGINDFYRTKNLGTV